MNVTLRGRVPAAAAVLSTLLLAAPAYAADGDGQGLTGSVGLGVASIPKFAGARDNRTVALPVLNLKYDRFFVGGESGLGLGYKLLDSASGWQASAIVSGGLRMARKESDAPALKGFGDISNTARAGFIVKYSHDWFEVGASSTWDVGGKHQGQLSSLFARASYRPTERFGLHAGPRIVYGSAKYNQTFFGVTDDQARQSGLSAYTPKSGVVSAAFELGADYRISKDWSLGGRASFGRLESDAANSPVVQKKAQNSAAAFFAYHF